MVDALRTANGLDRGYTHRAARRVAAGHRHAAGRAALLAARRAPTQPLWACIGDQRRRRRGPSSAATRRCGAHPPVARRRRSRGGRPGLVRRRRRRLLRAPGDQRRLAGRRPAFTAVAAPPGRPVDDVRRCRPARRWPRWRRAPARSTSPPRRHAEVAALGGDSSSPTTLTRRCGCVAVLAVPAGTAAPDGLAARLTSGWPPPGGTHRGGRRNRLPDADHDARPARRCGRSDDVMTTHGRTTVRTRRVAIAACRQRSCWWPRAAAAAMTTPGRRSDGDDERRRRSGRPG